MAEKRKGLTWWDVAAGVLLSLPFLTLTVLCVLILAGTQLGDMWDLSRAGIRLYCLAITGAGLTLAALSSIWILADLPDSARLRGWSMFLIGVGWAFGGAIAKWYFLARRDYEHPTLEPVRVMWPLGVAWVVVVLCSFYSLRLERKARASREAQSKSAENEEDE